MLCNMLNDLAEAIRRWTEKKCLPVFFGCASVGKHSPAKGGDPVPHCDSGVLEAGMPVPSDELHSYGQTAFEQ